MNGRRPVVVGTAAGGGMGLVGMLSWVTLRMQAGVARRAIPALGSGPACDRVYGEPTDPPLRLAILGDSAGAGLGADHGADTPGGRLAASLAARGRHVTLDVLAVSGSTSADLAPQVARALLLDPDVAVISIGANDVTHRVSLTAALAHQREAVRRLVAADVGVVVGTAPDLSAVRPIPQPLRWYAGVRSRAMADAQRSLEECGARVVPLGRMLAKTFCAEPGMFCDDRFHPSSQGYRLVCEALLPAVLAAAHLTSDEDAATSSP